jgi:hypothetical protein
MEKWQARLRRHQLEGGDSEVEELWRQRDGNTVGVMTVCEVRLAWGRRCGCEVGMTTQSGRIIARIASPR